MLISLVAERKRRGRPPGSCRPETALEIAQGHGMGAVVECTAAMEHITIARSIARRSRQMLRVLEQEIDHVIGLLCPAASSASGQAVGYAIGRLRSARVLTSTLQEVDERTCEHWSEQAAERVRAALEESRQVVSLCEGERRETGTA